MIVCMQDYRNKYKGFNVRIVKERKHLTHGTNNQTNEQVISQMSMYEYAYMYVCVMTSTNYFCICSSAFKDISLQ